MESERQEPMPQEPAADAEEAPPPFQPDPEIVSVRERGGDRAEVARMREAVRELGNRRRKG